MRGQGGPLCRQKAVKCFLLHPLTCVLSIIALRLQKCPSVALCENRAFTAYMDWWTVKAEMSFGSQLSEIFDVVKYKTAQYRHCSDVLAFPDAKRKSAFEYAQYAQIKINQRMRKVSSGPLLSIYTLCGTWGTAPLFCIHILVKHWILRTLFLETEITVLQKKLKYILCFTRVLPHVTVIKHSWIP